MEQQPQPNEPSRGGFDLSRVTAGQRALLITTLILFISLFLPWQGISFGPFAPFGGASISGFTGLGILVALLAIAVLVWEGLLAAGVTINLGTTSPALIGAAGGAAAALFGVISFLSKLTLIRWGAFVGLLAALATGFAAYLRFREAGTSPRPPAGPPAA